MEESSSPLQSDPELVINLEEAIDQIKSDLVKIQKRIKDEEEFFGEMDDDCPLFILDGRKREAWDYGVDYGYIMGVAAGLKVALTQLRRAI
jgi:hypothetical protein